MCCRFVRCHNVTAEVRLRTFLSPCMDDCGPYGQCKLLRTHNYLYAACECKAGKLVGRGAAVWAAWAPGGVALLGQGGLGEIGRAESTLAGHGESLAGRSIC